MKVYVENRSSVLTDDDVAAVLPSLHRQSYQVRQYWHTQVVDLMFGPPPTPDAWQIVIVDTGDVKGALGYHDYTPGGRPISYVFAKEDIDNGYSWTVTLSHEWVEMLLDPWVSGAMQTADATFYALELADPVEDDKFGYECMGFLMSDFVTPYWFVPGATGVFDYCKRVTKPLQVLAGGYAYVYENGQWYAEDAAGARKTAAELPERNRLQHYARSR